MTTPLLSGICALALGACAAQGLGTGSDDPEAEATNHDHQEMRAVSGEILNWTLEGDWYVSPVLAAPDGATRVGVFLTLTEPGTMPAMEAQLQVIGAPMGDWQTVAEDFGEEDTYVGVAEMPTLGDGARLRVYVEDAARILNLQWSAVVPEDASPEEEPVADDGAGSRRDALRSGLGDIGIVTRESWGARSTRCTSRNTRKTRFAIHHTVTPSSDPARQVRGAQAYHMSTRGWCDIGYHFLIGVDGSIYEGRPIDLLGAHVGGANTGNIGISFVGCYHSSGCRDWGPSRPTDSSISAGARLLGRLSRLYGISLDRGRVLGHREHLGSSTSCPGEYLLARIPAMLEAAGGTTSEDPPPMSEPEPDPSRIEGGACTHSHFGTYPQAGCSRDYQCCDGRWKTRAGGGCGACACVEETGTIGCDAASPPPPPAAGDEGDSCTHSYLGEYGHMACSADYQCCDGRWKTRAGGGCGECGCVEPSGIHGCTAAPTEAPEGANCEHTYGGSYAHSACSAAWQCCDGRWTEGHGSCGACYCTEATGTIGCGEDLPPPDGSMSGGDGSGEWLTQGGSEIPRRGLRNGTLESTLGMATEPYGRVVTAEGHEWVQGRISWFGGPEDRSIGPRDTGAITGERVRELNSPLRPSAEYAAANGEAYYWIAMRWNYSPNGRSFWRNARFILRNPRTGTKVVVRAVDWGPHTRTGRILDLSPQAIKDLGLSTDDEAQIAFAPPGTALGVVLSHEGR